MMLLDTDVMVDLLRQHPPAVAWVETRAEEEIVLPGYVVMELIQGCQDRADQKAVRKTLKDFRVAWPSPQACDDALEAFATFHLTHGLGLLDALIGQMAVAMGLALHTFNQKHYAAFAGLRTIQPYER